MAVLPFFAGNFSRFPLRRRTWHAPGEGRKGREGKARLQGRSEGETLSLRLRLIALVALVLALSLAAGGTVASLNASRAVEAEMRGALALARQTIDAGLAALARSADPERDLAELVAAFRGNRHLRVTWSGGAPALPTPAAAPAPAWFARFIGARPVALRIPVVLGGRSYGELAVETAPDNEIAEIWSEFGDSLLLLALFSLPTMLAIWLVIGGALRPLGRLAAALKRIGEGDYGARLAGRLPPELARLRDSFNRTAGQLAAMAAENRRLNEQLLSLQQQERSELARDLHDDVGPFLFAIHVDAARIGSHARDGRLAPIAGHAAAIADAVRHLQQQVKRMLARLRPIGLAELGLADAIGGLAEFWRRRHPEIAFRVVLAPDPQSFGELIDTTVYRIVQEGLSNAVRHSGPSAIEVRVAVEDAAVVVRVADDGGGMGDDPGIGFGLRGMRERVKAMGGALTVASAPGEGVTLTARLPLAGAAAPAPAAVSA
jgi:two-component system sensor histidine kinase UhpB